MSVERHQILLALMLFLVPPYFLWAGFIGHWAANNVAHPYGAAVAGGGALFPIWLAGFVWLVCSFLKAGRKP